MVICFCFCCFCAPAKTPAPLASDHPPSLQGEANKNRSPHAAQKTRLEYKKFTIESRRESYGTVALREKEMDLARVKQELNEVDAFMTAVESRKTESNA